MGWFDEQIRQRIQNDEQVFSEAFAQMAGMVGDIHHLSEVIRTKDELAKKALEEILKFYYIRAKEIPENITDMDEILEFMLRPSGIMHRNVKLEDNWYKDAVGAMLGTTVDGKLIALIPGKIGGYTYIDPVTEQVVKVNKHTVKNIDKYAVCFYKPFPLHSLHIKDLLLYCFSIMRAKDYALIFSLMLCVTLIGLAVPSINYKLYHEVLISKNVGFLLGVIMSLFFLYVSRIFMQAVQQLFQANIQLHMNLSVESATMMRVLSLPPDFFKEYSAGELASRVNSMKNLCQLLYQAIFTTGLSALLSLLYVTQILKYAPVLVMPSLVVTIATALFSVLTAFLYVEQTREMLYQGSKENGLVNALIAGVSKIRNAGAEKRAFAKWSAQYVKASTPRYNPPWYIKCNTVIPTAITLIGTWVMYMLALKSGISSAEYIAFNSAYSMVNGAFISLAGIATMAAHIKPVLEMVEPILKAEPEIAENKQVVTSLHGGIELNNISFRYSENMPLVLDNISLKIRPGQYVAIVGKTGCGKSTLMRLLLGFEKPSKGAIYYDGKDMQNMDLKSLRRKIGVVMQKGKLFQGDIFSNISISNPQMTLEQAWEAAEMAGMAEDIRNMPMGMQTLISEGGGGISGGQRQRILIARAIASKPRILMFDEATSALDNVTQKIVSESLDSLKCTRLVIAHRLSTIRHCNRILVLDQGKIVEDGTYDELVARNGYFAELVERQRVDI